jgi:hypothetical protein
MVVPELEKLVGDSRDDFLKLFRTSSHELSPDENQRLQSYLERIDVQRYLFEERRERAKIPQNASCTLISRDPYKIQTIYGELEIPDTLIPEQLKNKPDKGYHENIFFARLSADLDSMKILSISFNEYLKKATTEELKKIPGIESAPRGYWPRKR